jgi:glycosyltransferase involved in cell wall biosynthesis
VRKRILIFIASFLPGFRAGGPVRSIANFSALLKNEFDIYIVTSNHEYEEKKPYPNIKSNEWFLSTDLDLHLYYISDDQIGYYKIKEIIKDLAFDTLYLNGLWNYKFTFLPLIACVRLRRKETIILNPRGELNKGAISIKSGKKKLFLFVFKLLGLHNKINWNATNEIERRLIKSYFGGNAKSFVLSNFPKQTQNVWKPLYKSANSSQFVFLSRISQMKNLVFLLGLLKDVISETSLDIYGPLEDEVYWQECLILISNLPPHIQVEYKGEVKSHKVSKVLTQYHFFILPTLGENFGHAIFESMIEGKPVIISQNTPWTNLSSKKVGWDLSLTQEEKWIEIIDQCNNMSNKTYEEMSKSAWHYAQDYKSSPDLKAKAIKNFS